MRKQLAIAAAGIGLVTALAAAPNAMATTGTTATAPQSARAAATGAQPEENDTAKAGTPNFSAHPATCTTWDDTEACFQPYGDFIWVKDLVADGHSAYGEWVNNLRDGYGLWYGYRSGTCTNNLGYGKWGVCSKDFYENSTDPNAYGGQGSEIGIWSATWNGGASAVKVVLNNN